MESSGQRKLSAVPSSLPEEDAASRLLDAVWDVPIGLGLCDKDLSFVRVNETLAGLDGLPVDAHYESGETLARLPAAFAEGLRQAERRSSSPGRSCSLPFFILRGLVLIWALALFVLGNVLAAVFQLAHCVEEAEFIGRLGVETDWAEHQLATTVDFARGNTLLGWYLGGLNFQVEHHLFPGVCHLHYPALSRIVEETCAAHRGQYRCEPALRSALAANVRWLRRMGSATSLDVTTSCHRPASDSLARMAEHAS